MEQEPAGAEIGPMLIYLKRSVEASANIVYRRELDLLSFDWKTFAVVGNRNLVELSEVIGILNKDKSQVGRSIKRLVARDWLKTSNEGSPRRVNVGVTQQGAEKFEQMLRLGKIRSDALTAGLSESERESADCFFDRLTAQARYLWDHERSQSRRLAMEAGGD
jgi:DNA-binding MarR family transcriptional regulator